MRPSRRSARLQGKEAASAGPRDRGACPEASLRRFYEAVDQSGELKHQIMLRLLFFSAVRVSELAGIRVDALDLDAGKIFIERGKGDKDRVILFPDSLRLALKAYLAANPDNEYLFESRHLRPY